MNRMVVPAIALWILALPWSAPTLLGAPTLSGAPILSGAAAVPGGPTLCGGGVDPDFMDIVRSAPAADSYPSADAVYLRLDRHVRIDDEGRETMTLQRAVKIFNAQGRRAFSDFRIPYDSETQQVMIRTARTIREDYRTTDVEKDAINDITPTSLEGASIYSNVLEKVFSFPGALSGSVFALDVERRTEANEDGLFGGSILFRSDQPILESQFTLTVPEGMPLVYEILNPPRGRDLEPVIERSGGKTIYRWRVEDVPRFVPETNMPPREAVCPRLVYSTTADWGAVAAAFGESFFPHAVAEGELSDAVEEWIDGRVGEEERTREIFLHVVQDVRSVALDLGRGGFEPNPAPEVYHNRYGDCRDKAVLLVAALAKAGVDAYPVLYDRRPVELVEGVPALRQFNDVMVAARVGSQYRFLDPAAEYCIYGTYAKGGGNRGLLITRSGHERVTIPEIPEDRNTAAKLLRARVTADGAASGLAQCTLGGSFDRRARRSLAEKTAKERDMKFSGAANRLAEGAVLDRATVSDLRDLTEPVSVSLEFSAEEFGLVQGEMMILRMPEFPLEFANLPAYPGLENRVFDFVMDSTARDVYRVELEIPEGYAAVYVPRSMVVDDDIGRFAVETLLDLEENRITITRTQILKTRRVGVEEYDRFKDAVDAVNSAKNALVLLEKTP